MPPKEENFVVVNTSRTRQRITFFIVLVAVSGLLYYQYTLRQAKRGQEAAVYFICNTDAVRDSMQLLSNMFNRNATSNQIESAAIMILESIRSDRGLNASASYFRKISAESEADQKKVALKIAEEAYEACPETANPLISGMISGMIVGSFKK